MKFFLVIKHGILFMKAGYALVAWRSRCDHVVQRVACEQQKLAHLDISHSTNLGKANDGYICSANNTDVHQARMSECVIHHDTFTIKRDEVLLQAK
jgi:hypothetical protein